MAALYSGDSFVGSSHRHQILGVPVIRGGVGGTKLQATLEFRLSL